MGFHPGHPLKQLNSCAMGKTGANTSPYLFRKGSCHSSCRDCAVHMPRDPPICIILVLLAKMLFPGWKDGKAQNSPSPRFAPIRGL